MDATTDFGLPARRRGRRRRVGRYVLIAIVLIAIIEPIVMYRSLDRQREQRREAMQQAEMTTAKGPGAGL